MHLVRSSVIPHYLKQAMYCKGPLHCNDTIPKIRNKYSQERNRVATVQIHVSVSDLCNRLTGLPILLQESRWKYIDRSQTHECGLRPRNSFSVNL
jgi:hypothetical protein